MDNNKLYPAARNGWIDGFYVETGDYLYKDGKTLYVMRKSDIRGKKYSYLLGYRRVLNRNKRTGVFSPVWEDAYLPDAMRIAVWNGYVESKHNRYNGIADCQKNSTIRRKKCHPMTRSKNSFKGMIHLSYGEQCISRTFEGRRNSCYNADIM